MKCDNCGRIIPEQLSYCPTCKVNEQKIASSIAFGSLPENKDIVESNLTTMPEQQANISINQQQNEIGVLQPTLEVDNSSVAPIISQNDMFLNQTSNLETNSPVLHLIQPITKKEEQSEIPDISPSLTIQYDNEEKVQQTPNLKNKIILSIILFFVSIFLLYISSTFIAMLIISSIPFLNMVIRFLIYILMFNSLSNIFSGKNKVKSFFKHKFLITLGLLILIIVGYCFAPKILVSVDSNVMILIAEIIFYQIFIIIPALILILINTLLNYKGNTNAKKYTKNTFIIMVVTISVVSFFGAFSTQNENLNEKITKGRTACFVCQDLSSDDYVIYNDKIYYNASYNEIYAADLDGKNNELFFKIDNDGTYLRAKFVMNNILYVEMFNSSEKKTYTVNLNDRNDIKDYNYNISQDIYNGYAYWYTDMGVFKANIKTSEKEEIISSNSIQKIMLHNNDIYYLRWVESLKSQVIYKNNDSSIVYQYQYGTSNAAYKVQIVDDSLYVLDGIYFVKINLLSEELEKGINMPSNNDNIKLTFGNSGIIAQIVNSKIVRKYDYNLNMINDSSTEFIKNNNLDVYSDFNYLGNNLITLFYSRSRSDGSAEETLIIFNENTNKTEKYVDIISYTHDNENIYIIKNDKNSPILKVKYK